ncbi:MAG: isochorismatase [Desulfobacteraceae bacterium]|nr:MAG: isochorismatase [Desulfobacteraceae bacterium]
MAVPLPIPAHFHPEKVGQLWKVPYEERAVEAASWADKHGIRSSVEDSFRICLMLVDVQNTFCLPEFELFVGGRSGSGAVDDNKRLCEFIYRNLGLITEIAPTMDTHHPMQIFHAVALVDENGNHPSPHTQVTKEEAEAGKWRLNPKLFPYLGMDRERGEAYLRHYTEKLKEAGKYELTIWPYHALLGSIGHALAPAVDEAVFFHAIARLSPPNFQTKGDNPLTENYSVLGPEVREGPNGKPIASKNQIFIDQLLRFDAVIVAGQAKSHCVAWTIGDLLDELRVRNDMALASKVYLLEDCTSPVVVPGVIDYTDAADEAFRRFGEAGMKIVRSTDPMGSWPGMGR